MIETIITLLLLLLVIWIVFYIIDMLGLPGPVPMIAKLIIGIVVLLYILNMFVGGIHLKLSDATQQPQYAITQMA